MEKMEKAKQNIYTLNNHLELNGKLDLENCEKKSNKARKYLIVFLHFIAIYHKTGD